ncbi:MAG TPA: MBL fold metallo-hydrolase [Candidatus Limnocylindria bacterium]|nr:MBL fold metallo-hydrolase [Candidatus Limnocylindria bacterium]
MLESFTWYKQSAFRFKSERLVVYIDPWGLKGDLPPADLILITHAHGDHFSKDDISRVRAPKTVYVAPADVAKEFTGNVRPVKPGDRIDAAGVKIEAVPAYNIDPARLQAHPQANNWVGYVIQLAGRTYYHAGDTDHLPELEKIRTDVAFLPIGNGGFVMTVEEAAALAKAMRPKLAVPMHFGFYPGVGVAADGERFKRAAEGVAVEVMRPVNDYANR